MKFRVGLTYLLAFFRVFYPKSCHFLLSKYLLTHNTFCIAIFRYLVVNSILFIKRRISRFPWKSEKGNSRASTVLGKVSYEIQGFQSSLESFQGFQGPLGTLHLQDKLVSYFHSKPSTLWLTLIPWHWTCHLFVTVFWMFKVW